MSIIALTVFAGCSDIDRVSSEDGAASNCAVLGEMSADACQGEEELIVGCGWGSGAINVGNESATVLPACSSTVVTCESALEAAEQSCRGYWVETLAPEEPAAESSTCCDSGNLGCIDVIATCTW